LVAAGEQLFDIELAEVAHDGDDVVEFGKRFSRQWWSAPRRAHAGAACRFHAQRRVLEHDAVRGQGAAALGRQQEHVRMRLAARDVGGAGDGVEFLAQVQAVEREVDVFAAQVATASLMPVASGAR
jgi:hypothetical protein